MNEIVSVLQEWVMGLLLLALPILSVFAIKALKAWGDKLLSDIEANKPSLSWAIESAAEIAVMAAEKMKLSEFIHDKLGYALEIAQRHLDSAGWDEIDVKLVRAAIEAEVLRQFPKE